jgi:phosphoglycolate phosphatase
MKGQAPRQAGIKNFPLAVESVVIDLDGTLIHTAPDIAKAINRMLADLLMPPIEEALVQTYIGNGITQLIKRVLTRDMDAEPDAELFARAKTIYPPHYAAVFRMCSHPFPDVMEGMEALKKAGYRLACITNKLEKYTVPLLKDTGLYDYFELILSGDSLPKMKPDPLPLLHACEHFGITPDKMLLIGDSFNDAQAARAAGCHVFCVPYGYNHGRHVSEIDTDAVVNGLLDASRLIVRT